MIPVHAARVLILITILTSKSAAPAELLDWPAVVATFGNTTTIVIPGTGTIGKANLYPSTVNVSGFSGEVLAVTVTLNGFSHTFADDVDILLVGPGGQSVLLTSDAGGSIDVSDLTLTFEDGAAALPDFGPLVSGTFAPTDFGGGDTFPAPAPLEPYGTALSDFNGTNPNGTWSLFVADDVAGDVGAIASGFTLTIIATEVPTSANDAFTTAFQTPLSVAAPGVLANDNSNGGGPLSVVQATQSANGLVSIGSAGDFTYTPNAGFIGVDTFTYRAASSWGTGSIATVSITVQGPPPPTPPPPPPPHADAAAYAATYDRRTAAQRSARFVNRRRHRHVALDASHGRPGPDRVPAGGWSFARRGPGQHPNGQSPPDLFVRRTDRLVLRASENDRGRQHQWTVE